MLSLRARRLSPKIRLRGTRARSEGVREFQDHTLPGEVPQPEGDMDAAPLSDDEIEALNPDFHPTTKQLVDFRIAHDNNGHLTPSDVVQNDRAGKWKTRVGQMDKTALRVR